jgi:hypothetical protein
MASTHVDDDRSIGELFAEASRDVGQLVRQEIELAKTEAREELGKAARGATFFGGAGVLGYLARCSRSPWPGRSPRSCPQASRS